MHGWMDDGWMDRWTDRGVRPDLAQGFLAMLFIPSFSAHSGCQAFLVSMTWTVATAWSSTGAVNSCFSLSMALKSHTLFKGPCGQKRRGALGPGGERSASLSWVLFGTLLQLLLGSGRRSCWLQFASGSLMLSRAEETRDMGEG